MKLHAHTASTANKALAAVMGEELFLDSDSHKTTFFDISQTTHCLICEASNASPIEVLVNYDLLAIIDQDLPHPQLQERARQEVHANMEELTTAFWDLRGII